VRAVADLDLCQGHQVCRLEAPEVFGFDGAADRVVVLDAHPAEDQRAAVARAVTYCPALALSIEED
jgi:ferredoxin